MQTPQVGIAAARRPASGRELMQLAVLGKVTFKSNALRYCVTP